MFNLLKYPSWWLSAQLILHPTAAAAADICPLQMNISSISDTRPPVLLYLLHYFPCQKICHFLDSKGLFCDTVVNLPFFEVGMVKYHACCSG